MKLYAIRHGRTDWNVRKIMQGRTDTPLNEEGIAQAYETKEALKPYTFDHVFASPQKRAWQTAEIVTEGRGLTLIPADALRERSYGEFEGRGRDVFNYLDFWAYGKNLKYEEAENIRDFFGRVWPFLDELKTNYPQERVLLVTHSGVIRAIECYAHGIMADDELGLWLPKNCSVHEYDL